jgi:hypothetical protein
MAGAGSRLACAIGAGLMSKEANEGGDKFPASHDVDRNPATCKSLCEGCCVGVYLLRFSKPPLATLIKPQRVQRLSGPASCGATSGSGGKFEQLVD